MKKYKSSGWYNESHRHSLAAKGIKTSKKKHNPSLVGAGALIGTGLGFVGGGPVGAISGGIIGTTAGVGAEVLAKPFSKNNKNKKSKKTFKIAYRFDKKSDALDYMNELEINDIPSKLEKKYNYFAVLVPKKHLEFEPGRPNARSVYRGMKG